MATHSRNNLLLSSFKKLVYSIANSNSNATNYTHLKFKQFHFFKFSLEQSHNEEPRFFSNLVFSWNFGLEINGNGRTALLRGTKQDPFLMGFGCRHQVEKKSHMVADPQICDRYLYCPKDSSGGIAMYCRPNRGFDEKEGKCLPLKGMSKF